MAKEKISIWLGCTTRTYLKETIISLDKILTHLGITYSIIEGNSTKEPGLEICCGSVLFNTGQRQKALVNLRKVEEALNTKKVRNLVALCPGCTRTFLEYYLPRKSNQLESVEHISQILQHYLDEFEFRPKKPGKSTRVTYHDPCHLGRHMGIYDPPREVLETLPGVELIEMPTTREAAFCCGSGGGVRAYNKELANFASGMRVREALGVEVKYLVTACPFCERSLQAGVELELNKPENKSSLKILNLVDFVGRFIE